MSDNGGPAFPTPDVRDEFGNGIIQGSSGMSLRDWFAARALPPLLTTIYSWRREVEGGVVPLAAEMAYEVADAMLAEREKAEGAEQ
ncbi:hypothetical protein AB0L20_32160 [Streptomyces albidoflavus]|uniref:hypothetical protein n=1 Tax=Streptomyces albidoflavus TaxID=1886 RepID=UPI003435DD36